MQVAMVGTGYVGLVSGTCFADAAHHVTCLDVDADKVERLKRGEIPIYEPGLEDLIVRNFNEGRLGFTTDAQVAVSDADCVFLCVGTPQSDSGAADLTYLESAANDVAPWLKEHAILVVKSTVPVGTNRKVAAWVRGITNTPLFFASNPEFLKEGSAVRDFKLPDRVVVGTDDEQAAERLRELHASFVDDDRPFLSLSIESAEMTKYVANCFLATKISFINEMANLCDSVGADIDQVRQGIGFDARIGFSFLAPGVGYGGSCFPKDVRALEHLAKQQQVSSRILHSVDQVNNDQKKVLFEKIASAFDQRLEGRTIAIWGLAFKPETDDVREAPALQLVRSLLAAGANVRACDPIARDNFANDLRKEITYCDDPMATLEGADALALVTEWQQFHEPDWQAVRNHLASGFVFDGRNIYDPAVLAKHDLIHVGIGKGTRG